MKCVLEFDPDEVAGLVKRSLTTKEYVATSEQAWNKELRTDGLDPSAVSPRKTPHWTDVDKSKLEPGLILVVGRGIYLASNDADQDWENGAYQVSFAHGINADEQRYDDWNDALQRIAPDGEREIFIHADQFCDAISAATAKDWIEIDYDDESDDVLFGKRYNAVVKVRPR